MSGKARLSVFLTAALVLEMGSSLVELEQSVAKDISRTASDD